MKNIEENMGFESKCEEDFYYWIWIFGPHFSILLFENSTSEFSEAL
jgi:hypothetical protein